MGDAFRGGCDAADGEPDLVLRLNGRIAQLADRLGCVQAGRNYSLFRKDQVVMGPLRTQTFNLK
jgi:hypothetical protein